MFWYASDIAMGVRFARIDSLDNRHLNLQTVLFYLRDLGHGFITARHYGSALVGCLHKHGATFATPQDCLLCELFFVACEIDRVDAEELSDWPQWHWGGAKSSIKVFRKVA